MYDDEAVRTDVSKVPLFQVFRATISNTTTSLTDKLFVTIRDQSDDDYDRKMAHPHGPVLGWDKRSDGSFPHEGNAATVFLDDVGDYWMVSWDPNA